MNIGSKIREIRQSKGMTQTALCEDKITRNMLSAIECGKASPSISTITYIAKKLDTPISYFLSDDITLFELKKAASIGGIREAYTERRYLDCIKRISDLGECDDELSLMLAYSYFEVGKASLLSGALISAKSQLELCKKHCDATIYNTSSLTAVLPIYFAVAENIQSPLLELDTRAIYENSEFSGEYEFFKYVTLDFSYDYRTPLFRDHIRAKQLIRERSYALALDILKTLEDGKSINGYNAYAYFSIYADMETCYRQLADFENAYRYSSKRMSMIEGFKS